MPGISAKKGRFGCLIQAARIKFKSGQKTLPILKMAARRLFDCSPNILPVSLPSKRGICGQGYLLRFPCSRKNATFAKCNRLNEMFMTE